MDACPRIRGLWALSRRLIINADDFGMTAGVNSGIVKGLKEGVLTSTTLMPNMPGTEDAFEYCRMDPELPVGLHFNITSGCPVSRAEEVPTLVNERENFHAIRTLIPLLNGGLVDAVDVIREFDAQMNLMLQHGIRPTHVDSHKHLHLFPDILKLLLDRMKHFGIKTMRYSEKSPREIYGSMGLDVQGLQANPAVSVIREDGFQVPDGLLGLDLVGQLNEKTLKNILAMLPEGTWELMCHPGETDAQLGQLSTLTGGRKEDLAGVMGQTIGQVIKDAGIRLISYRDL